VAIDGLSFAIRRGDIVAVLGKTGCGESTVFNLIGRLTEPSGGTVRVPGHDAFANSHSFAEKSGSYSRGIA
jgi:NitT/TauT family transport system ATP-binding protein